MTVEPSWSSKDLAHALCDALVAKGQLKEKPAFIRSDREDKIAGIFESIGLDGEKMCSFENVGPLEMMVRRGTSGEAWVGQVQDALVTMLPEGVRNAAKNMAMDSGTLEELETAKERTEKLRDRREQQSESKGGGKGGRDRDDRDGGYDDRGGKGRHSSKATDLMGECNKYKCPDCALAFETWSHCLAHLRESSHASPENKNGLQQRCMIRNQRAAATEISMMKLTEDMAEIYAVKFADEDDMDYDDKVGEMKKAIESMSEDYDNKVEQMKSPMVKTKTDVGNIYDTNAKLAAKLTKMETDMAQIYASKFADEKICGPAAWLAREVKVKKSIESMSEDYDHMVDEMKEAMKARPRTMDSLALQMNH